MPSWTNDQSLAINTRGGKVIVSAAAGSGKTAVLSERVINYVLKGGNIDDLLIVTFTKAAALEMKGRIKEKIIDSYNKDKENKHLENQISLVESAKITTMDAFYGDIVKSNFEKLNIKRTFDILSSEEEKMIKDDVLNSVLNDSFDEVKGYKDLLLAFGANSTDLIKNEVLKVNDFFETIPFKDKFIKKTLENYDKSSTYYKDLLLSQIKRNMESFNKIYEEIITDLYNASDEFDKILLNVRKEQNYIKDLLKVTNFDELSSRLRSIVFDTLRTPKGHKDDPEMIRYKVIREEFKNEIRKKLNELSFVSDEQFFKEQLFFKNNLETLFEVVNIFSEKLLLEKKKRNTFSFSDIAHFVIELLIQNGKKTALADDISKKFKEILIDEYQDTNNLQNVIFGAISDNNSNLFIVGDVKQSIYRFRSACPEIFNNDKNNASKESFPRLITLSKNFRSRKEVLDFCNFIFENTMTEYFGEVNYDENERLYLGASFEEKENLDCEVHVIDGAQKNDDDLDELNKSQKEAIYVADQIKKILDEKEMIYDNKKGMWRQVKASDIVILLRSLKNSSLYLEALNKRKISVYSENSPAYFDNYEIKLIINFLKIIDNPYDDVALMSVLSSDLFNISYDDISLVRSKNKNISLYENLLKESDLKYLSFIQDLEELKSYASINSLYKLLNKIYCMFNVLPIIRAMKGGMQRGKNLIQMLNHSINFEKTESKSLHEFINYIERVILNKGTLEGINPLSEGDNVLITTIHKSKGLEYPYVFVCETGKNFNFSDLKNDMMINDELGIAFNVKNPTYNTKYESIPIRIFKEYEKSKTLSEELRILYVALTRAKEKIIITGYSNNLKNLVVKASAKIGDEQIISSLYLKNITNYLDIIVACLLRHKACEDLRDLSEVKPKVFLSESKIKLLIKDGSLINEKEFMEKQMISKTNFKYDLIFDKDEEVKSFPLKLSVSDLKTNNNFIRKPNFMLDRVDHSSVGTLYHKIFELLPINKYSIKTLEEQLNNLVDNSKINKKELSLIDIEKIFSYLTSDIYDLLLTADDVMREKKLTFKVPASYYDNSLKSGKILIDGVVDLIFKVKDTYYIVDYKTDNVNSMEELKQRYKVQLDLYELGVKDLMMAQKVRKYLYSIKLNKFTEV